MVKLEQVRVCVRACMPGWGGLWGYVPEPNGEDRTVRGILAGPGACPLFSSGESRWDVVGPAHSGHALGGLAPVATPITHLAAHSAAGGSGSTSKDEPHTKPPALRPAQPHPNPLGSEMNIGNALEPDTRRQPRSHPPELQHQAAANPAAGRKSRACTQRKPCPKARCGKDLTDFMTSVRANK